jgi:hypothetical protein
VIYNIKNIHNFATRKKVGVDWLDFPHFMEIRMFFLSGVKKCESLQEREKDFSSLKDNSVLTPLPRQSISQP